FSSLYLKSSTFTSPNYPSPYSNDVTCKYTFVGSVKERVQITFNDFHLAHPTLKDDQQSKGTQSDYVEFSNFNVQVADRKMGRLCDVKDGLSRYVHSDGDFFRVTFKSNYIYDGTGFKALYQFKKSDGRLHIHVYKML
ncbi:hypothetical protein HELRODRAFT_73048, partial [Helobdella robusta]|uniref:CUB domain-containing protein n=1 Tax=Helobdella robusta TaxID=6412 RepID=T1G191_HELRO